MHSHCTLSSVNFHKDGGQTEWVASRIVSKSFFFGFKSDASATNVKTEIGTYQYQQNNCTCRRGIGTTQPDLHASKCDGKNKLWTSTWKWNLISRTWKISGNFKCICVALQVICSWEWINSRTRLDGVAYSASSTLLRYVTDTLNGKWMKMNRWNAS